MRLSAGAFPRRVQEERRAVDPTGPRRYRSLAMEPCHGALPVGERKVEILDLGSASTETLAFYSGLSCKIYFADFFVDWKSGSAESGKSRDDFASRCASLLPFDNSMRFDLIHTWDLFNYMKRDEITALSSHIRRFSTDRAPLVSMIWNRPRIPAQPNRYAIIDLETLEYRPSTSGERRGPRYTEPDLLRAMPGFGAGRSFLLRHGIQEYVFEPRG